MGVLLLVSDTQVIKAQAKTYILIALAVLATGLAITYLLAQYTQRQLSGPIEWLVNITKKISGSGDYSLRAGAHMPDSTPMEIATLSQEFDRMIDQVQAKDNAIQQANQMLEKKVEERTA